MYVNKWVLVLLFCLTCGGGALRVVDALTCSIEVDRESEAEDEARYWKGTSAFWQELSDRWARNYDACRERDERPSWRDTAERVGRRCVQAGDCDWEARRLHGLDDEKAFYVFAPARLW